MTRAHDVDSTGRRPKFLSGHTLYPTLNWQGDGAQLITTSPRTTMALELQEPPIQRLFKCADLPYVLPILVGCVFYFISTLRRKKALRLPPGPQGLPFVQNLFDLPSEKPWFTAIEWARKYGEQITPPAKFAVLMIVSGDVVHVGAFGQHIVYLNSCETAVDLLEKRPSLYSDRFHSSMLEL